MAVRTSPAGGQALPGWVRTRAGTDPGTVHLIVVDPGAVTTAEVRRCCAQLADDGYHRIVTNALRQADAHALLDAGFEVRESLALLGRGLETVDDLARGHRARRSRRLDAVAALDRLAFGDRALDRPALVDALAATPRARLRVCGRSRTPSAYAITGVAGRRAYVQRLAVHPDARGRGLARSLVADGLRWARRRGARTAIVNTHPDNVAARALYEALGFASLPDRLVVLERSL